MGFARGKQNAFDTRFQMTNPAPITSSFGITAKTRCLMSPSRLGIEQVMKIIHANVLPPPSPAAIIQRSERRGRRSERSIKFYRVQNQRYNEGTMANPNTL